MPVDIDTAGFLAGALGTLNAIDGLVQAEVQRVGREAASDARNRAPRRTGTLSASVEAHPIKNGVEIVVGADYGAYVEYGTWDTPSQPFLRPALNARAAGFGRGIR